MAKPYSIITLNKTDFVKPVRNQKTQIQRFSNSDFFIDK